MCDLFQANPWKPLLCTNCHQNRSGHQNLDKCDHLSTNLPASNSSMHLYEEIMAQYFTTAIEVLPSIENENEIIENDEDSFSDEEQDLVKPTSIEFVQNQSMINTQGIILMGPDLRTKQLPTKKPKKMNLLKKSKSNADECLKKTDILENNSSKLWWFKLKKANAIQTEIVNESNKPITSPSLNNQRVRVLPEINKLTLNEALSMARRQHLVPNREPKLPPTITTTNSKSFRLPTVSNYGASIASTTSSSSTQSSNEYDTNVLNNSTMGESTYLTAVSPVEKSLSLTTQMDKTHKLTIERLTSDLRIIIDEYKQNLPVARFQTFKSFLDQDHSSKILSNDGIYFLLLQILDEFSHHSIDHFLITYHSTIPIIVTTTSTSRNEEESIEEFIKNLAKKLFDTSSLPVFNDLPTFETLAYRYLYNQILPNWNTDLENNVSMQRVQLLDLFWNKIQSVRRIQINDDNERSIFTLYYLMRFISQSDQLMI